MILPWLARRHRIPLERAEALWRQADEIAALHAGAANGSNHAKLAIEGLLKLMRCEGRALLPANEAATVDPMIALALGQMAWQRALVQIWFNTVSGFAKIGASAYARSPRRREQLLG
jgi:hypothetical protein